MSSHVTTMRDRHENSYAFVPLLNLLQVQEEHLQGSGGGQRLRHEARHPDLWRRRRSRVRGGPPRRPAQPAHAAALWIAQSPAEPAVRQLGHVQLFG